MIFFFQATFAQKKQLVDSIQIGVKTQETRLQNECQGSGAGNASDLVHDTRRHVNPGGGGGLLGLIFAGYVPLASQSPYPIIVNSLANCRSHISHSWANM